MKTIDTTQGEHTPDETGDDVWGLVATIVVHPDFRRLGEQTGTSLPGDVLALSRDQPDFTNPGKRGLSLGDPHVSRTPVRVIPAGTDFILEPGGRPLMVDGQTLAAPLELPASRLAKGLLLRLARTVWVSVRRAFPCPSADDLGLIGCSVEIASLRLRLRALARGHQPVVLVGETGTGKDRAARLIHDLSTAPAEPWVALRAGDLPTGGDPVEAALAQARGGVLYLDEIGDFPPSVQASLLRALDRFGASRAAPEPRLVTSTSLEPTVLLEQGRVRPALLHRLAGAVVPLSPLRERREDVAAQLRRVALDTLVGAGRDPEDAISRGVLDPGQQACLIQHAWPGNTRELEERVRALILDGAGVLDGALSLESPAPTVSPPHPPATPPPSTSASVLTFPPIETPLPPGATAADRRFAGRLDRAVRDLLGGPDLTIEAIGRRVGLSRRQLHREIHRIVGLAPMDWLTERRMFVARTLLQGGEARTVAEVAVAIGVSPAWFSRSYAVHFGRSPSVDLLGDGVRRRPERDLPLARSG